ncbi:MAG: hypothetical protein HC881_08210 [Leptolyngbyaceae cyanobacterium SL_7_1]|nr:hypothetical protein [Leptolyngbyaceae cyanobacterium SL_7_1]
METVRKITNEWAIAGQLTLNELHQLVEAGYRSVVNLRSVNEIGFLRDEQQKIERLGLHYAHCPIPAETLSLEDLLPVIQQLDALPKPMLVHCDSGIRSSINRANATFNPTGHWSRRCLPKNYQARTARIKNRDHCELCG